MLPVYLQSSHCKQTKALDKIQASENAPFTFFNIKPEWGTSVEKLAREHQKAVCSRWYVEYCSEYAFRYELHARRGFTENGSKAGLAYEYGEPFCKLNNSQIETLHISQQMQREKAPFAYTASTPDGIANPQIIQAMQEQTKLGWSEPVLIHFNLKQCADVEILDRLASFLKCERWRRGIPNPHVNAGKKRAAPKTGKSFTSIEALDVWTQLPREEAKATGYAEKQARDARKAIAELFGGK